MEKSAYCEINQQYIKVYLYKEGANRCFQYVNSIDYSIKKVYSDLVTVETLLSSNQDIEYWTPVRADLQAKLDDLQDMRANILGRVETFEDNFFAKVKLYMERYLLPYKDDLEEKLEQLEASSMKDFDETMISDAQILVLSLQSQLLIIENILATRNLEELVSYIPSYLYLKKEIE